MKEIGELIKILERAVSEADGEVCKLDNHTAIEIIQALQDADLNSQLADICIDKCEREARVGDAVRTAKNKDKPKAYAQAAKAMGWDNGAAAFNDALLNEYLDAIGVSYCLSIRGAEEIVSILKGDYTPPLLGKKEAIQMLCEKHQLHCYESAYKRLQRAKKARVEEMKEQGKDFTCLLNILPGNWPSPKAGTE